MIKDGSGTKSNGTSRTKEEFANGTRPRHGNENPFFIIAVVKSGGNGIQGQMRSLIQRSSGSGSSKTKISNVEGSGGRNNHHTRPVTVSSSIVF